MLKHMRILVTGGAGFIGTHLCRALAAKDGGHAVQVLDLRPPRSAVPGVTYRRGDVRDRELLGPLVAGADVVFHLAATVSVPVCQKDPEESYSNNFSATVRLLEELHREARRRGEAPGLVFASTAALYGNRGDDGRALREEDAATEFESFYAAQKLASEQAIRLYHKSFGLPAQVFRFFNVFGEGQDPASPYSGVITVFTACARAGRPLALNGGGAQTRDFVAVGDLVGALLQALELPRAAWDALPMNLGTGRATTVRELARMIADLAGPDGRLRLLDAPARDGDVLHSRADISRAQRLLGYAPATGLRDGLRELLG